MSNQIYVESSLGTPTFKKRFEIVERKGLGHPDTICDLVMNQISIELSKLYIKETGFVQHHNMDKALLVAGQTENQFGGGNILKPMKMILGDRATFSFNEKEFPVGDFAINTAKSWIKKNLRFVNPENIDFQLEIGTTSKELQSVFKDPNSFAANDTSVLVGYAPYTNTESLVLEAEEFLNSKKFKDEFPESGEDIKVMAFRNQDQVELTVAMAFIDKFIESENQYFRKKDEILQKISEFTANKYNLKISPSINCLDSKGYGVSGLYLTVLGTSADGADSGEVGRGNMANQVISPSRPAGAEATAGKNPVSHIGKIYNALSFRIADEIHSEIPGLEEVFVWMYNVIGQPVKNPKAVIVQPIVENNSKIEKEEKSKINEIVQKQLENIPNFCNELIEGKIKIA